MNAAVPACLRKSRAKAASPFALKLPDDIGAGHTPEALAEE
jgi:hypothetical protein